MIALAEYLKDSEMEPEAEDTYLDAFNYLDNEDEVRSIWFLRASKYFSRQKKYDEALNILLKGIEYLPDNAKIRMEAAFLYDRIGIPYRAVEELRYALLLDPKNRRARIILQELVAEQ